MKKFQIEGQGYIPEIALDPETGHFSISGESYHEYTLEFFQPVFAWLNEFLAQPGKNIRMDFRMSYFNTSSSRRFLEILNLLEDYEKSGKGKVEVNWYFEEDDMDMQETGEEYEQDVSLKFNLIPYSA